MKALQVYFKVPADVQGEEGRFVASCFLLTATCTGATKHEALSALTEAVRAAGRAVALSRETLGPDHPRVANALNTLAARFMLPESRASRPRTTSARRSA